MDKIGYVATIGTFDGVHLGHQFVLRQLVQRAREHSLGSLVITFDRSPRQQQVLTPLDEKLQLIRQTGVERVEVLPFTPELKSLTARRFMDEVLRQQLDVKELLIGYDNHFGHRAPGSNEGFDDYVDYGRELGISVVGLPPEGSVSSSLVRRQLLDGDVRAAAESLGRYYAISGHVGHGYHIGTGLGFPTANIIPDDGHQLIPAAGAYAVSVCIESGVFAGMMNIGTRPTFEGHHTTLEVNILNHDEDLYEKPISVRLVERIREERRFSSPEALRQQLNDDAAKVQEIINKNR